MTRYRWIIFLIFSILFCATGVALLLYAQGYRYHFGRKTLEKTGQLSIESKPKGASLSVNGQQSFGRALFSEGEQDGKTPERIPGLLSGTYTVHLESDGYYPWTRVVTVESGQATLIRPAILIRKNATDEITPTLERTATLAAVPLSQVFVATQNELTVFNPKTKQSRIILRAGEPFSFVSKSPNEQSILLASKKNAWLVGSDGRLDPLILPRDTIDQFRWSTNGDRIVGLTGGKIFQLFSRSKPRVLTTTSASDALLHGSSLIFVPKENPREVRRLSLLEKTSPEEVVVRVSSAISRIIATHGSHLVIAYGKNDLAVVDDSSDGTTQSSLRAGTEARFWDARTLISWNDFEVFRTDFINERAATPQLIVRRSVPIRKVELLPEIGYIAVLFDDGSVSVIEQTGAESRNRYTLADRSIKDITALDGKGLVWIRSESGKDVMRLETVRLVQ